MFRGKISAWACRLLVPLATLIPLPPAAAGDPRPPEYRLNAGDRFVFERRTWPVTEHMRLMRPTLVEQVELWVLDVQGDEAIILGDVIRIVSSNIEPMRGVIFRMDVYGRKRFDDECAARAAEVESVLEALPILGLPVQNPQSWVSGPDLFGREYRCRKAGPDPEHDGALRVDYELHSAWGVEDARDFTREGRYWFDPRIGIVVRTETAQRDGTAGLALETAMKLRQREHRERDWIDRRAAEARRYQQMLRHEDRLIEDAMENPDKADAAIEQIRRLWSTFAKEFPDASDSPLSLLAAGRVALLRDDEVRLTTRALVAQRWLNRKAADWSLQDAQDHTVTSESLRRGVTLELFWCTDAMSGLRALEPLRQLAEQLEHPVKPPAPGAAPIGVICINTDQNAETARRAMEKAGMGMKQVHGAALAGIEGLPNEPVLRLIDARGVVRNVWFGWRPSYSFVAEVARKLAESP